MVLNHEQIINWEELERDNEDDDPLPDYGTKGWVLVEIISIGESRVYRYDIEEFHVDQTASTFWILEGVGGSYWIDQHAPDGLEPGWYVFEDVVGTYHKGDGWMTDDDEEWEFKCVRPATEDEIDQLAVSK